MIIVTDKQMILLELAMQTGGAFYPNLGMWNTRRHKHFDITGSGYASAIRSLLSRGLVRPWSDANVRYAFDVCDFVKDAFNAGNISLPPVGGKVGGI
jgi:hypothetical protein